MRESGSQHTAKSPRVQDALRLRIAPGSLIWLVVAVVCLAVLTPTAAQEAESDEGTLYFTERPFSDTNDRWNFTTFPPQSDDSGRTRRANQQAVPTFLADWTWFLAIAPDNWSVEEGHDWEFVLTIEGLDQLYPLPGSLYPPGVPVQDGVPAHELQIQVFSGDDIAVAAGSLLVPVTEVEEGLQQYSVPVTFNETYEFSRDRSDHLRVLISVSGRGEEAESPLMLHYGGTDGSFLAASGYPFRALRELELQYLQQEKCQDLILQQRFCEDLQNETDDGDSGEDGGNTTADPDAPEAQENQTGDNGPGTRTAPGPGLWLVGFGAALAGLARRVRGEFPSRPS